MTITNDNCNCNIVNYNYINDLLRIQFKSNLQFKVQIYIINQLLNCCIAQHIQHLFKHILLQLQYN